MSCRDHGVPRLQIDIDVAVNVLIPGGMENIVKLPQIVKHAVTAKQLHRLPASQRPVRLIALNAKHRKDGFRAHSLPSLHIGKFDFSRSFFFDRIQHSEQLMSGFLLPFRCAQLPFAQQNRSALLSPRLHYARQNAKHQQLCVEIGELLLRQIISDRALVLPMGQGIH